MTDAFTIRHSAALISAIELMISTKTIKPGIGKTLQAIAAYWNPKGHIYPSQSTLASMTGNHRRTIVTHIATLTSMGVIQTSNMPSRVINGKTVAGSLLYRFNTAKLGHLFNKARTTLKNAAIKAAKRQQKDHTGPVENDHTIRAKAQVDKITVSAALADWFKSLCRKAFKQEADHQAKLVQQQAYKNAVHRNRVARGQEFSRAEQKRRAALAEKARPEREKASAIGQRINELTQLLREARFNAQRFSASMKAELMTLTDNGKRLDIGSRLALESFTG